MTNPRKFLLLILTGFWLLSSNSLNAKSVSVSSPNQSIVFTLSDDNSSPRYSVSFKGQLIIEPSNLGFTFADSPALSQGLAISDYQLSQSDSTWQQPWGESQFIRDHHNELMVKLEAPNNPSHQYTLRIRVFNDGLGFRYEVPAISQKTILITDELTEFKFAHSENYQAWWIPAQGWNRYEFLYQNTPFDKIDRVNTPFTVRNKSNVHVSIHEAALTDFASMTLDQRRPGTFKSSLVPWSDGIKVKKSGAFSTPWRTIQLANSAKGLLNSQLILNLNEPNKLGDVSWVKPGKYIGIWWGMHLGVNTWGSGTKHGATTQEAKRYLDFAAKYGFDGVLVEGWNIGWDGSWFSNGDVFSFTQAYDDFDLKAVTDYAKSKHIKLIGHHETSGSVTNYRNQMADAYDLYQQLGVTQIKTGYVADGGNIKRLDEKGRAIKEWHDGQFMVNEYLFSVTEAAKRKISINTHEPIKDTGLRRTYPNWLSREGARGQEFNAWGSPPNDPAHTVNLVYTRMLSGPMDFTPGIFNLAFNGLDAENRVQTTLAKQLALYVVIYSPIQMAADLPKHYLERLDAFQFIRDVPTDWKTSVALNGEIGEWVTLVRQDKYSNDWYLGAITNEFAREIKIELNFLDKDKRYLAQIYRDGDKADWKTNPYDYIIEEKTVSAETVLNFKLATSGGVAIRFKAL
ncbi:glycoside hydrolase family 97 protein [Aliikangiella marina]|nr:glycoside hydrolase family 97 protein [Aliikangiella marina]